MKIRLAGLALLAALPLAAHHGSAAYDESHIVTMNGVVESVQWANPHVEITLHVAGPNGTETAWTVEGLPPTLLPWN